MKSNITGIVMLAVVTMFFCQCSSEDKRPAGEYLMMCDSLLKINQPEKAIETLTLIEKYYPADTPMIVRSWDMTADIYASSMNQYDKSIDHLNKIITAYPQSAEAPKSLFKIGFTYENMIKDITKARQNYEEFLKKYPNHELALSVSVSLEHLGESDEELLDRLLKKSDLTKDTIQ
jgi:tetratricopeptide (TPR) repeat protein